MKLIVLKNEELAKKDGALDEALKKQNSDFEKALKKKDDDLLKISAEMDKMKIELKNGLEVLAKKSKENHSDAVPRDVVEKQLRAAFQKRQEEVEKKKEEDEEVERLKRV